MKKVSIVVLFICVFSIPTVIAPPPGTSNDQLLYSQLNEDGSTASCNADGGTAFVGQTGGTFLIKAGAVKTSNAAPTLLFNRSGSSSGFGPSVGGDGVVRFNVTPLANTALYTWDLVEHVNASGRYYFTLKIVLNNSGVSTFDTMRIKAYTGAGSATTPVYGMTSNSELGLISYLRIPGGECAHVNQITGAVWNASVIVPDAPDTPTLGCSIDYMDVTCSWTESSGASGYNLTRVSPSGVATTYALPNTPLSYSETLAQDGMWYYNITAWNGDGTSDPSSNVFLNASYRPLFGDDGTIWGPNGRQALADDSGMSYTSIGMLWGIVILAATAISGYMVGQLAQREWFGAIVGSVVGLFLATLMGFFPAWVGAFMGVGGVAIFLAVKSRSGGN